LQCNGAGITVTSGSTLDCAGHTITGPGGDNSQFGIYVFQATGATVRNCRVTGWRRGLRIDQGAGNHVEGVETFGNGDPASHEQGGYGLDVGSSTDNLIESCNVHDNADEGIHIGEGSDRTTVLNTTSTGNYREQLYVLQNAGTIVMGASLRGSKQTSSAALFLKNATGASVSQSTVRDGNLTIHGSSTGIVVQDLVQLASGIRFEADGPDVPSSNTILRSQVSDAFECVHDRSSVGNTVVDTTFKSCMFDAVETGSASQPAETTLINSPLPGGPINLDQDSTLKIGWHLNVEVRDSAGTAVVGASVTVVDRLGRTVLQAQTRSDGKIPTADVIASEIQGSTTSNLTPHRISASKSGVGTASMGFMLDRDQELTLILH
jgi:parallel beta-helix repeat protein